MGFDKVIAPGVTRRTGYWGRYDGSTKEYKFFDLSFSSTFAGVTGTIEDTLNNIDAGTGESQRVGRKIIIWGIGIKGRLQILTTIAGALTGHDWVRFIVYIDKQTNGAAAAPADLLQSADVESFYELVNKGRFQILCDDHVELHATTNDKDLMWASKIHILRKWFNVEIPVEFSGITGAISEIRSNNVGVLVISELGDCDYKFTSRIRFSD